MKNPLHAIAFSLLLGIAGGGAGVQPVWAQDTIYYHDRAAKKDDAILTGTIQEESVGRILVRANVGGVKEIAALDINDIEYEVPPRFKFDYRSAINTEKPAKAGSKETDHRRTLVLAVEKYQDLLRKMPGANPRIKRHIEYKIAMLLALQAEEDDSLSAEAIAKLAKFDRDHPDSWQISGCARQLARLKLAKGDLEGAQKIFADLAARPKATDDIRRNCDLWIAHVLVRGKKYADAEKKLQSVVKSLGPDDPQAIRIHVALAECQAAAGKIDEAAKKLTDIIGKLDDPELKSVAYNTLGDCYRLAGKSEDAMWAYLWVDVMYHHNRHEHAKALYFLYKIFKEHKDDAKANQCKEKLEKDPKFAGLEYQRLLLSEK